MSAALDLFYFSAKIMKKSFDLTGQRFGKLVALEKSQKRTKDGRILWLCKCDCGTFTEVRRDGLKSGDIKSCSCSQAAFHLIHGDASCTYKKAKRLYQIWKGINNRCYNQNNNNYKYYGEKGVKICSEWQSYPVFKFWALCAGYQDDLIIHRINGKGDYSPSNCTWMTPSDHARLHNRQRGKSRSGG